MPLNMLSVYERLCHVYSGDWASACHRVLPLAGINDLRELHPHSVDERRIHLHHGHHAYHHRRRHVRLVHWSFRTRPGPSATVLQ